MQDKRRQGKIECKTKTKNRIEKNKQQTKNRIEKTSQDDTREKDKTTRVGGWVVVSKNHKKKGLGSELGLD